MSTLASLRILLGLDASDVKAGSAGVRGEMRQIQADANRANQALGQMGKGIAAGLGLGAGLGAFALTSKAVAGLVDGIGDSIKAASDLNESLSKSQVVFGQSSAAIEAFGNDAAVNLGLSKQAAIEAAATFGNLFKTMGLGQNDIRDMSTDIVSLAGDLASFNNIGTDEALLKLRSGLVGEAEPLRSLGVQLTEATVKAKAMALGLADANGNLSESAKVQARYALILEQTKTAQGDFARTSDGLANSQRILAAEAENLSSKIGTALLPGITAFVHFLAEEAIPEIEHLAGVIGGIIGDIGDLVHTVGTLGQGSDDVGPRIIGVADAIDLVTGAFNKVTTPGGNYIANAQNSAKATEELTSVTIEQAAASALQANALGVASRELDGARQTTLAAAASGAAYSGALDETARAALALTVAIGTSAGASKEQKQAASDAMAVFKQLGTVFDGFNGVVDEGAAASDHFGFANRAAMDLAVGGMQGAYKTANDLHDAINDIPTSKTVTITIQTLAESAGSRNVAERVGAANDPASANDPAVAAANSAFLNDQAARAAAAAAARKAAADAAAREAKSAADSAAREAQSARDRAAREAEQKARDSARQQASDYRDAMSAAYDKISADAHKVFDAVHAANLKIIRDAQDTANAQIEAQEKAIRGFVTGEQAKLDAERAHRRELELRADVANAVSPEDRARAQQSLNDFLADQRIAFLSAQADTQVAALDAAKAANDATAAAQTQAENDRFKQQTTDFDKALKALEDGLKRHPELWKSSQENVLKLLLKYDVDYQKAGTAAGKAYADGLLAASLAIEQAARGVAVSGARAEGNVVVAPPVVPVVPTPPAQQSTDASYAAVTLGYSKSPAVERSVQSQITPMGEYAGGGKLGDVYLDAEKVGEFYAKRGATLDAIYNPVPVSIGPKR